MSGEDGLEVADEVLGHGALGQDHHVDDVDLVERPNQHSVDELEIDGFGRYEVEEGERLPLGALDRLRPRPEVTLPDPQRPGSSKMLAGWRRGSVPGRWRRALCHTASTPGPRTHA